MLSKQVFSFSLALKIVTFGAGALFTLTAPGILKENYAELIEIFSIISVFTMVAAYGSAGNVMRNYATAKRNSSENFLIYSLLPKKIVVYSLIFVTVSYFYKWYLAVAVIIADLGLIGSLILYAEEKYIFKQIYLPVQAILKVFLLFILKANFFLFVLLYYTVPRALYIIQVFIKIKQGYVERKKKGKHIIVNNEKSTYLMLLLFEIYLHSPIVISPMLYGDGIITNQFAFLFAIGMVSYGLISTFNELILPTLLVSRNDKDKHKYYAKFGVLIAILYFIITAFVLRFLTKLMTVDEIQSTPFKDICLICIFFFSAYTMNLIRQIYFSQDMQVKWIYVFITSLIIGLLVLYSIPIAFTEVILLVGLFVVFSTFFTLHSEKL